jgi:hypothetical protein
MKHFVIQNGNTGFSLWFGSAPSAADALRAFSRSVGGYSTSGSQQLGVVVGTKSQVEAVELWHRQPAHGLPKGLPPPIVYSASELWFIFKSCESLCPGLDKKLQLNDSIIVPMDE